MKKYFAAVLLLVLATASGSSCFKPATSAIPTISSPWAGVEMYTVPESRITTGVNGTFAIAVPGPALPNSLVWMNDGSGVLSLLEQQSIDVQTTSTALPLPSYAAYLFQAVKMGSSQVFLVEMDDSGHIFNSYAFDVITGP